MQESILRRQMLERQQKQQDLENQIRQEMIAYGRQRDAVGDARYEDNKSYGRGRDAVSDRRYEDETGYRRGRDAIGVAVRRSDGSIVWVNNSVAVIRRTDGATYGVLAVTLISSSGSFCASKPVSRAATNWAAL